MRTRFVRRLVASAALGWVATALVAPPADAAVLCTKLRKDGTYGSTLRIREACKEREVVVDPTALGFCCADGSTSTTTSVTTTTATSTSVCPTFTTTTLGVPDCGGGICFGLCANALACVEGESGCECTGPPLDCQAVTAGGQCGGTCPEGLTCQTVQPVGEDGCPQSPRCGCAPAF